MNEPSSTAVPAIICTAYGGPENVKLGDQPLASTGPGEVRIAVKAAGVNMADVMAVAGIHQNTPPAPFTPGFEVAGEVAAVGEGVATLAPGDRVMAVFGHGGFSQSVVCPETHAVKIPDEVDFATAAAIPIAFGTGYVALVHRARLRPGEWLFVQGAAGNIGGGALQIGKLLGARTIATGSGAEGCDKVLALGADFAVDYKTEDVPARVREITGGEGAAVIFDAVTGSAFEATLDALAREGRHIIAGAGAGTVPEISLMQLIIRHAGLLGVDVDDYLHRSPAVTAQFMTGIAGWLARGWLKPREPKTMPLAQAAEALGLVASGKADGKLVLLTS